MNPHRLAVVLTVASVVLLANAKREVRPPPEEHLFASYRNATFTANGWLGGTILPARAFRVERVNVHIATGGGGGAGNTVVSITDGTNTCTATWTCVATQTTGMKAAALAGTCTFPAGASVTAQISTAGCTSTQPVGTTTNIVGNWL